MTFCYSHRKQDPFVRLLKSIVMDSSISWKATGILSYAFSRNLDTWTFYKSEMMRHKTDGERSFDSGIKELEKAGYLYRRRKQDSKTGQMMGWEWHFFEVPISEEDFEKFYRNLQNSNVGKMPKSAKGSPSKNEYNNKNEHIKKINEEESLTFEKKKRKSLTFQEEDINPRNFLSNKEEQGYFDLLVNFLPKKGKKLDPKAVSWWIKKYGIKKVKDAVKVYMQQLDKHKSNRKAPIPRDMGAYVCNALKKEICPENEDMKENKQYAKNLSQDYPSITVLEKYVRIEKGIFKKEMYYNCPINIFKEWLTENVELAKDYG